MAKLSNFEPLAELKGIYVARSSTLRCTAIVLTDKSVCLFNPVVGLDDKIKASIAEIGKVAFICAPNHYHNKALEAYQAAFPEAQLCTSNAAQPRLAKVTGLNFHDLTKLAGKLPKPLQLVEPEGLKNGEVWITAIPRSTGKGRVTTAAWFVVDAFAGIKMTANHDRAKEVSYLKTFPNYGVLDKTIYQSWIARQLAADKPSMIIPCHGAIMQSTTLGKTVKAAMKELFS